MADQKRLTRRESVIGGVCGGLAHFFGLDPTIVRVVFAAWAIIGQHAIFVYLLLWVIVPTEADAKAGASAAETAKHGAEELGAKAKDLASGFGKAVGDKKPDAAWIFGLLVLMGGVAWFFDELGVNLFGWVDWDWMLPLGIVALGAWLMNRARSKAEAAAEAEDHIDEV